MTVEHSLLTSIHPGAHSDASSPSANANDLWVQRTGSAPYQLWLRNAANSAWEAVGIAASISGEFAADDLKANGLTGAANATRLVGRTASVAPASGTFSTGDHITTTDGKMFICTSGGSPGTWVQVGGVVSLTTVTAQLSSDTTMSSANTFGDGPSISCATGTWAVTSSCCVQGGSNGGVTGKLWDGTTVGSSGYTGVGAENYTHMALSWVFTPGSTTTYKFSATSSNASGAIKAAAANNSAGNNASSIVGIKVA